MARALPLSRLGAAPLGVFNGTLTLPDKRNLSLVLLEAGLASRFGADRSVHADLVLAKAAGLKVWADYSEEAAAEEVAANAANASEMEPIPDAHKQRVELTLTEIADGAHFHAHVAGDDTVARLHASSRVRLRVKGGRGLRGNCNVVSVERVAALPAPRHAVVSDASRTCPAGAAARPDARAVRPLGAGGRVPARPPHRRRAEQRGW